MESIVLLIFIIIVFIFFSSLSKSSKNYKEKDRLNDELLRNESKNMEHLSTVTSCKRGTISERNLALKLLALNFDSRAIFHDIYIKKRNNDYTQIDLVLPTKVGIFVFEVKDYSGWLFGNCNNKSWTQMLAFGAEKNRFYNPVKQNQGHISALKHQLSDIGEIPYYSIIVFYGDCELKEISNIPTHTEICYSSEVLKVISRIMSTQPDANYHNKQKIMKVLQQGLKNGEDENIISEHISQVERITPPQATIKKRVANSRARKSKQFNVLRTIRRLSKWL